MSELAPFTVATRRLSYKDVELSYREDRRVLIVNMETSGVPEYSHVGVDTAFAQWTDPPGVTLSADEQLTVKNRIEHWAASKGLRFHFGPPVDMNAYYAEREAQGWKINRGRDSAGRVTVTFDPPLRIRLRWWLAKLWKFSR